MRLTTIVVDEREERAQSWVARLKQFGVGAVSGPLTTGDFLWLADEKTVCLERKTLSNLVLSLKHEDKGTGSNQLMAQMKRLGEYDYPILFVVQERMLMGAPELDSLLLSVQFETGVKLYVCPPGEEAHRLSLLYRFFARESHNSMSRPATPLPSKYRYVNRTHRLKVATLMCTPSVGEAKANDLLEANGDSLCRVAQLDEAELKKLVGAKTAQTFREFWA